jgi:glycosyltransferase involved in cell wall biosynthesis
MHAIKHLDLDADRFKKIWVVPHEYARKLYEREAQSIDVLDRKGRECVGEYEEWPKMGDTEYDDLLAESIVFLDLYDSSANNTILECIARNTPVLVNRLPAVVEYLGEDYPFYFQDLDEAADKVQDEGLVKRAHEYLTGIDKTRYRVEYFRQSFVDSVVYRNLPVLGGSRRRPGLKIDTRKELNIVRGQPLSTDFMFVICFRNQQNKILRCLKSVVRQCAGRYDAGVALIDDASADNGLQTAMEYLEASKVRFVAVQNLDRKLFTRNLYNANVHLATRADTVLIEVDGDDYLEDADVLGILSRHYSKGARKTFGSFRMAPGSKHFPGFEVVDNPHVVTDVANAWNLDFCYPWMHLKTYRRELFLDVPLDYFLERNGGAWLKTAEDLSSHPMMMALAGRSVHFIRDILYVYDFSGSDHELHEDDRPDYIVSNFYRVPSGTFMGEYWEQARRRRLRDNTRGSTSSLIAGIGASRDDGQEALTA